MENKNQNEVISTDDIGLTKMSKNMVFVTRVSYGKESTPEADRKYQIDGKGLVVTIQELIDAGFTPVIEERGN